MNMEFVDKLPLSSLIAECNAHRNTKHFCLTRENDDKELFWEASILVSRGKEEVVGGKEMWIDRVVEEVGIGKTPEEAVANLLLTLKGQKLEK